MLSGKRGDSGYHPEKKPRYPGKPDSDSVREIFKGCDDFAMREIFVGGEKKHPVWLCFVDGLVSGEAVSREILRPLTEPGRFHSGENLSESVLHGAVSGCTAVLRDTLEKTVSDIMNGFCALIFDSEAKAVTFEVKSGDKRAVSEPVTEKAVKGAKDAFVESIRTNTALVRRKLRDPRLKISEIVVGRRSATKVDVLYIEGLTNMNIVAEVRRKLGAMDVDALIGAAELEEYLADSRKSLFPLIITTERADKLCMNLAEGRVAVIADGLPLGYIVPATFAQTLVVPEDRAQHFAVSTAITLVRYLGLLLTLLLPAFYVAIAMYHQEMLPTKLMLSVIESKQDVPFSTAAEVLAMLVAFELLQEAGLRLPEPVGQTVSIIGALIVGQSAVEARVLSPVVVIVVAMAGVAGYTMPNQDMAAALRVWRFIFAVSAMLGGLFSLVLAVVMLIYHLASLESFGVPYMSPFAGGSGRHTARRSFLRLPVPEDKFRDEALGVENVRRRK